MRPALRSCWNCGELSWNGLNENGNKNRIENESYNGLDKEKNLGGVEALLQEELLLLSGSQLLRREVPVSRVHVQSTQLRCRCVALQRIRYVTCEKSYQSLFLIQQIF